MKKLILILLICLIINAVFAEEERFEDVAVQLVIDNSANMLETFEDGNQKNLVVEESINTFIDESPEVLLSLDLIGGAEGCNLNTNNIPFGIYEDQKFKSRISSLINPQGETPLLLTLENAINTFEDVDKKYIILITGEKDTCVLEKNALTENIDDSIVLDMSFNEGSEDTTATFVPNGGYDGRGAYSFDGDDYLVISDDSSFDLSEFTISFWIKTTQTGDGSNWYDSVMIAEKDQPGFSNNGFGIVLGDNKGTIVFVVVDDTLESNSEINDGNWHLVTLVKTTTNKYIYIDGSLDKSEADSGSIINDQLIHIGSEKGIDNYFIGSLDEFRIYNRALSVSEINDLYSKHDVQNLNNDLSSLKTDDVVIYSVGLNIDDEGKQQLMALSESTNGSYFDVNNKDQLNEALSTINKEIFVDEVIPEIKTDDSEVKTSNSDVKVVDSIKKDSDKDFSSIGKKLLLYSVIGLVIVLLLILLLIVPLVKKTNN